MDAAVVVGLAVVQGLTEFLPVSSDGHLAIGGWLFGLRAPSLPVVVLLHAGTLLATLVVLRNEVASLGRAAASLLLGPRRGLTDDEGRLLVGVLVATAPTALVGWWLEPHVEALSARPLAVGLGLLGSAAAVLLTHRSRGDRETLGAGRCLLVGLAQGLAVLPGLSRSGTTIAACMLLGLHARAAFRFSFLLSMPAILGALILEARRVDEIGALGWLAWIGGLVAFATGAGALLVLRGLVERGRLGWFAAYLIPVGLALLAWDVMGEPSATSPHGGVGP
ncbi:MAG: undecaprenyl-diphosphate phosphatase [Myxococcota bacterium]|nr:undecaprenyl-diphosphate phosphatase [Myxococcota bacterium]MDW8361207.1 undecaprenyl-diphosphate phosphatase [Myxococcales bacterium]